MLRHVATMQWQSSIIKLNSPHWLKIIRVIGSFVPMAEMKDQGGVQRMHFCSDRKNLTVKKNTCAPLKNYSLLQQKWQKQSDPDPEYN